MAGTNSLVRVPPDSSGRGIATQQITRASQPLEVQEVLTAYQADSTAVGVNVTTAAVAVYAANPLRRGLVLQNVSDTRIICRFGAGNIPDATLGSETGFAVEPNGGTYPFFTMVDTRVLNAIHGGSGTKRLLVTEWVG